MRHLVSVSDLGRDDVHWLVARGAEYATLKDVPPVLAGDIVGIYFAKTSTRTRTAFSAAALRQGAQILNFGPADLQTNTGETLEDTARVLSKMLDVLVVRTAADQREMRVLADQSTMSVINAMSQAEHPTQALTDCAMMLRHFGHVEGLRVVYVGEGNNTAAALALTLSQFGGVELHLRTPPGYGLDPGIRKQAQALAERDGASVTEQHTMADFPEGADVVYTTRWQTTGTTKADDLWRDAFGPFQVDRALLRRSPKAAFMHDLPAHRGEEVTAEVLDGPASIVFDQAEQKLFTAMAVLEWCRA